MDYSLSEEADLTEYTGVFDKNLDENELYHLYYQYGNSPDLGDGLDHFEAQIMGESFPAFCINIVRQVWPNLWISFAACLAWRTFRGFFRFLLFRGPATIRRNFLLGDAFNWLFLLPCHEALATTYTMAHSERVFTV